MLYADIERVVLELKKQDISGANLAAYVDVLQKLDLGKNEQATEKPDSTQIENHEQS